MKEKTDRLRRKSGGHIGLTEDFDTFRDVDPERLRYWAAICLEFNYAEKTLDECVGLAIRAHTSLFLEVSSRISSIEAKKDLVKAGVQVAPTLAGEPANLIFDSLSFFFGCKQHRDVIAHSAIFHRNANIGFSYVRQGSTYEVDLSLETLSIVYDHVFQGGLEIASVFRMVEHIWDEWDLAPEGDMEIGAIRNSAGFKRSVSALQSLQAQRRSLREIPPFLHSA
jgi:hypothetical protein